MGEVLEFPAVGDRRWDELEQRFAANMRGAGVSGTGIDWILSETRRRVIQAGDLARPVDGAAPQAPYEGATLFALCLVSQLNLALAEVYLLRSSEESPPETTARILKLVPDGKSDSAEPS